MNHHCGFGGIGPMGKVIRILAMSLGAIAIAGIFSLAFGWLLKVLWNWLLPSLFGLPLITYWQAFGLLVLSKLLFSGMLPSPGHHGQGMKHRCGGHDDALEPHQLRHYREYWRDRGKDDFEDYLKDIEEKP